MNPFRPLVRTSTYSTLAFFAAGIPIAAAALGLLVAGWTAAAVLAVTPLVVGVLIAFRAGVGAVAAGDAALAGAFLGVEAHPRITSGGRGFWGRGKAVLADGVFWRQQAYLVLRLTFGFGLAVAAVSWLAAALGAIAFPIWYRWSDLRFGSWHVDTVGRSFVLVPAGIVALVLWGHAMQGLGALWGRLITLLLADAERGEVPPLTKDARIRALVAHAGTSAFLVALATLIWSLTGHGYFWPEWVGLPLALLVAGHGVVELADRAPQLRRRRGLVVHAGMSAAINAFLVLVWAVTTRGYFWPEWPLLAGALLLVLHVALEAATRRERLARRVGELEVSRAGAVDEQELKLRRIERDLHDGAQARLVSLGMSLGLAELKLETDPEAARALVEEARQGVGIALTELRDLARGIHPPVLSDRGLRAALEGLVSSSAVAVDLDVDLDDRLAPAVETAAYFVVAEAITNAAKHGESTRIEVAVCRHGDVLELVVVDDGRGGADPLGSGLTGLRRRVEALDGTFAVTSPEGGPTRVHAELPCVS